MKMLLNGAWVDLSPEEWRAFAGHRRLRCGRFGVVEYHGPVFRAGSDRPAPVTRDCRCSACTMFEPGQEHSERLRPVVDAMR